MNRRNRITFSSILANKKHKESKVRVPCVPNVPIQYTSTLGTRTLMFLKIFRNIYDQFKERIAYG